MVLVFYPLAFSPVCSHQLPAIQKELAAFEALDAVVLGVSVDSHYANTAFARSLGLSFALLSDWKRAASTAYGVLNTARGYSGRAIFVVDRQGNLAYVDVSPTPDLVPSNAAVLDAPEPAPVVGPPAAAALRPSVRMDRDKPVVLVVDRESDATTSLIAFLRRHELEVIWTWDGESADNALDQQPVDCLVAELRVHRIDGMQLLRAGAGTQSRDLHGADRRGGRHRGRRSRRCGRAPTTSR